MLEICAENRDSIFESKIFNQLSGTGHDELLNNGTNNRNESANMVSLSDIKLS